MKKLKILYVTTPTTTDDNRGRCGISLTGSLFANILTTHPIYHVEVIYTENPNDVIDKLKDYNPNAVIFNYDPGPMPWVAQINVREICPNAKGFCVVYNEANQLSESWNPNTNPNWQYMLTFDPTIRESDYAFSLTHILPPAPTTPYIESDIPIIGWHGFPAPHKGIPRLALQIQEEFDEAIFRLHMPDGYFAMKFGLDYPRKTVESFIGLITKPGIKVEISDNWLDDQGIVNWLSQNTVNCYFFDMDSPSIGMSGSLDYAIAACRPIAITRCHEFKTCWDLTPTIEIEKTTIAEVIKNGTAPLEHLHAKYTNEKIWNDITRIFEKTGL
jgi:hypothetical protein